jgi:hypothetical protein
MFPELLLIATGILLTIVLGASVLIGARINRLSESLPSDLDARLTDVESSLGRVESVVSRSEAAIRQQAGRERDAENALRRDVTSALKLLAQGLGALADDLADLRRVVDTRLSDMHNEAKTSQARTEEFVGRFRAVANELMLIVQHTANTQEDRIEDHSRLIASLAQGIEAKQTALREAVESRLEALRTETSAKLEHIRVTVDGEIHTARDLRVSDSMRRIGECLDLLQREIAEMQRVSTVGAAPKIFPREFDGRR